MKYDLHCHTFYSGDGLSSPGQIVKAGIRAGLDGLAVMDHDEIRGALKALEYAKPNFEVIPGAEISTRIGHVLALGIRELPAKPRSVEELIESVHGLGGLAVLAHPFSWFPGKRKPPNTELVKKFDAVETFNAGFWTLNSKAAELASRCGLGETAGSDAHHFREVGLAYTQCDGEEPLEAVRNRKTRVHGKRISLRRFLSVNLARRLRHDERLQV